MPITNYNPPISSLIRLEDFPDELSFISGGIENLLKTVGFKDLQISKSRSGNAAIYQLTAIPNLKISLGIPGTDGLEIILNPDYNNQSNNNTVFPISLRYNWEIIKYVKEFSGASFSESVDAFFRLLLELSEVDESQLLRNALDIFLADEIDALTKFATDFNNSFNPTTNLVPDLNLPNPVKDLILQMNNAGNNFNSFEVILQHFILETSNLDEVFDKLFRLFNDWMGGITGDSLKKLFLPDFEFALESLSIGLQFPTKYLRQVDLITGEPLDNGNGGDVPSIILFDLGSIRYSTEIGFEFFDINDTTIQFPKSEILKSGFTLEILGMKLDLSRKVNIPEVYADGRPNDFIGVYVQDGTIGFPAFWKHDDGNSTGQITVRNLLIGTGGISGTIGLEAKTAGNPAPLISATFGNDFKVSLNKFSLEFQQNAIIGSDISGTMKIPGFKDANDNDAELEIDVHIGQDGEFSVTVTEADGFDLRVPQAFVLNIRSASVGREDDRFYLSVSGSLSFEGTLASVLKSSIDFQEMIIWDDGQFEIKGGGLELPKAIGLDKPPLKMAITAIHLGSDEREFDTGSAVVLRKYKYFGLDGMLKVDPGGVDAKGQGIKFYFSEDNNYGGRHVFLRIDSLKVDLIFPGDADPADAAVAINGWLSIKDAPNGLPGSEYGGGVTISIKKLGSGMVGMRFNPKVPYFIVDAELELNKAIPLGNTGLGLYGFRGLIGKYFVATKNAAGVPDTDPWWKYYKAKVASEYKEGAQVGKFDPIGGFSLGLGVSLATSTDGGKIFSSKIFLLLSLRELFMFQGQAAILSERIKLTDPNDPPFFALLVISKESIEAALGVNYLVPDDKSTPGDIATVQGVLELGFFFKDSSAWYLNIGRDLPENYRIQVRLFDLFDVYFYFMLNAKGIRTGAGASFEWGDKWGPLEAYLWAYLDIAAKVAFKPKQFGGSIQLGGGIDISIFGLGFGITAAAGLAAEAPEPFNISGFVEACFKAVGKEWCARFEFSWERNPNVDTTRIGVVNEGERGIASSCQAVNIQTKEIFPLNYQPVSGSGVMPPPAYGAGSSAWKGSFDDFIIPLDCFVDLDFTNGLNPIGNASTSKFGTMGGGANHVKSVAPQKGKTPQVYHNFKVEDVVVYAWDPTLNGGNGTWSEYNIYEAVTQWIDPTGLNTPPAYNTSDLKQGYWQMEEPNKFNKLRILAQNPLSYITQNDSNFIPENNGITSESIFCDETERAHTCINFANYIPTRKNEVTDWTTDFTVTGLPIPSTANALNLISGAYPTQYLGFLPEGTLHVFGDLSIITSGSDGGIVTSPQPLNGNSIGLGIRQNSAIEINFNEPMVCIDFNVTTYTDQISIEYYRLIVDPNGSGNNLIEELITSVTLTQGAINSAEQQYQDENSPVDKMIIRSGADPHGENMPTLCEPELTMEGESLQAFLDTLAANGQLLTPITLNDGTNSPIYDGVFFNSPLYQWGGSVSAPDLAYSITTAGSTIELNVSDGNNYDCITTLIGPFRFDWSTVVRFSNLRKDPAYPAPGPNYHFLIDAEISGGGTVVINGHSTCHNVLNCYDDLSTWLFSMCYLNVEDFAFNQTVLDSTANTAQVNSLMEGLEKTVQPIWRPNTTFAVAVKVKESVTGGGTATHSDTYFYGFKTAGPIGHFHRYLDAGGNEVIREDYQALLDQDQEESFVLRNLKPYINYALSYPNANGELLNAKPLFYEDPKILLFFTRPYVYHMFEGWSTYVGNAATSAGMTIDIRDAIEPEIAPVGTVSWQFENFPVKDKDAQALSNLVTNAPQGGCEPTQLNDFGINAQIDVTGLKPLKLYTAIIYNTYNDGINTSVKREVHKYPFRTSRYANFEQQIQSYILAEDQGVPVKTAIYDVEAGAGINVADAIAIVAGGSNLLLTDYAERIERILQGVLKLGTLQPPIATEFNFVKQNGTILGVWIRNPEPFNDPKIPADAIEESVNLTIDASGTFATFFSKDCRDIFITNSAMDLSGGTYEFTFNYLEWDKTTLDYENAATETVTIIVPTAS